jgi:hypothetical protein
MNTDFFTTKKRRNTNNFNHGLPFVVPTKKGLHPPRHKVAGEVSPLGSKAARPAAKADGFF